VTTAKLKSQTNRNITDTKIVGVSQLCIRPKADGCKLNEASLRRDITLPVSFVPMTLTLFKCGPFDIAFREVLSALVL
jgi:hypothetical protein